MTPDPVRADRAFGATILAGFGSLWLEVWVWFSQRDQWWRYLLVAAGGAVMMAAALRIYRRNRAADAGHPASAAPRRTSRLFTLINIGQWVVIFIGANVLNNIGLSAWDIPFIILVVGAHFLPLARLFRRPSHYVTGVAMMLLAVGYPYVGAGPLSTVGLLGAGLILWASALWGMAGDVRPA
jgi:hypothetical protein